MGFTKLKSSTDITDDIMLAKTILQNLKPERAIIIESSELIIAAPICGINNLR